MRKFLILASILVVLATGTAPLAQAVDDPVQRAIAWLHTQQLADGSFGGASVTADVVYVLALAGENPAGLAWTSAWRTERFERLGCSRSRLCLQ